MNEGLTKTLTVAIDGPAGAGKSTVAQRVARALGATYIDTGAMYRAVAWSALDKGISPEDADAIGELAEALEIRLLPAIDDGPTRVFVDGREITESLRTPEISRVTSPISSIPRVRARLVELQRILGQQDNAVMEGRDIGTVVFPDAPVKIFLTASTQRRAGRRQAELAARGIAMELDQLEQEIAQRDARDASRDVAPMRPASDAIIVDTDGLDIEEVVVRLLEICREALPSHD